MKKYEPYNLEPFTRLLAWAYNKGWYSGRRELLTIRRAENERQKH